MKKRRYEGLISEERENRLNMTEGMTYDEIVEFYQEHPEFFSETNDQWKEIDLTPQEMCERYGLVDMTDFFGRIGVDLDALSNREEQR